MSVKASWCRTIVSGTCRFVGTVVLGLSAGVTTWAATGVGAGAAAWVGAGVAIAQPGGGGPGGGMMELLMGGGMGGMRGRGLEATYSSRDLDRAIETLGFDEAQKAAAKTIFEGYQAQMQDMAAEVRTKMERLREEIRDSGDNSLWSQMGDIMREAGAKQKEADQIYMDELKSLCTEDQAPKWASYERTQRRERNLGMGFLSGERVDLVSMVDKLELAEGVKASLAPTLEQYEAEVDREIQNRVKVYEELRAEAQPMFQNMRGFRDLQNLDMGKINAMMTKGRDASNRVREVNRRFARQIEGQLPEETRDEFSMAVKRQSFPDVYRQTRAERMLVAAAGFGDLTPEQKESVQQLKDQFMRDLEVANESLAKLQEENEMTVTAEQLMDWGRQGEGPMADARNKKRTLGREAEEKLKRILTPEQVERLPAGGDDDRRGGGPGMRRGRGEEGGAEGDAPPRREPRAVRPGGGGS